MKAASRALRAHKGRTALTVLGMLIGIASIIMVFSAGEGVRGLVVGQVESFGTDIIDTEIKVPSSKKGQAGEQRSAMNLAQGVQITTLTVDDMEDACRLANVRRGYAAIIGQETAGYGSEADRAMIFGASAAFIDIDKTDVATGRFYSEEEDKSFAQVAVLGPGIKKKLFGDKEAIGELIKIRNAKYRVIGVTVPRGAMMMINFDDFIYMPIRTLQRKVMGINHVQMMIHQVRDMSRVEETAEEIRSMLRVNHHLPEPAGARTDWTDTGKDDFRTVTIAEISKVYGTVTGALTLLLLAIVAISLVVGGVGILNVMYVSVSERTPEIGLRKALGARDSDILLQFLSESVVVTLVGGIVGVVVGFLLSWLIAFAASSSGLDWKFIVPLRAYVTAGVFSVAFGILFGLFPARRAARMDPVEALRGE